MKKLTLNNFVDQKRPASHIMFAVISALSVVFTLLKNKSSIPFAEIFLIFLIGLLQLEVFIFAARKIFAGKDYQPSVSGKDFMRAMLIRFMVFITLCFVAAFVIILICWMWSLCCAPMCGIWEARRWSVLLWLPGKIPAL